MPVRWCWCAAACTAHPYRHRSDAAGEPAQVGVERLGAFGPAVCSVVVCGEPMLFGQQVEDLVEVVVGAVDVGAAADE